MAREISAEILEINRGSFDEHCEFVGIHPERHPGRGN